MKKTLCAFLFVLILPMANAFAACATNEIDVLGDGTQCEATKFSVTTTELAANDTIKFTMSANGTFYIDCGDDGTLTQNTSSYGTISGKTATRTSTSSTTYTCTYSTAGTKTIRFGGIATGYQTSSYTNVISFYGGGTNAKIAGLSGSLGTIFPVLNGVVPRFYQTFYNCTNLTSIPSTLFSGINTSSATNTSGMFLYTFAYTQITSIPSGLFDSIDTSSATDTSYMFRGTFSGCRSLTSIPSGLLSGINTSSAMDASYMFDGMFSNCTSLTSIPADLFSGITIGAQYMFNQTFYYCTGLTSLPIGLFSNVTTAGNSMFYQTFYYCANLSGYIPPTTFAGLINAGAPSATSMWASTFYNTNLATSCDSYNKPQFITGYESSWSGKVSCGCDIGYWGDGITCTACTNTTPLHTSYAPSITATCNWECDIGYHLDNDACELTEFNLNPGEYLPAASDTPTQCTANSFCSGGDTVYYNANNDQGITACSVVGDGSYTSSVVGASANTDCYKACTIADANIAHATAISGKDYYGARTDTCSATACEDGYSISTSSLINPSEPYLNTTIGTVVYSGIGYLSNNTSNSGVNSNAATYGLTTPGTFAVEYSDNKGIIKGRSQCSSTIGTKGIATGITSASEITTNDTLSDTYGLYCWCTVDEYTPVGGASVPMFGPWVFLASFNSGVWAANCGIYCAQYCAERLGDTRINYLSNPSRQEKYLLYRYAVFDSRKTELDICTGNTITVNWSNASAADIDANEAGTLTYGGDIRTPRAATIIPGKVFLGWKFSAPAPEPDQ